MNFYWRRTVCFFILFFVAAVGCRSTLPKSQGEGASYLECQLDREAVSCHGEVVQLSTQKGVSASLAISEMLSRRRKSKRAQLLKLNVSADPPAVALVGFLMSAERAGFERLELALGEGAYVEIALPDSERSPPLQMAHLYIALDGDRSLTSTTFEQFAKEEGEGPFNPAQLQEALRDICTPPAECRHAIVSLPGTTPMTPLLVWLRALRQAGGEQVSVRLALRDRSGASAAKGANRAALAVGATRERLQKQDEEFRHCLRLGPDEAANARGTVTLTFTITRLGIVFDATVDPERSTIVEPEVVRCIVERVTKTQFPKPEGSELTVDHTFRF